MYIQYCSVFFLRRGPVYDCHRSSLASATPGALGVEAVRSKEGMIVGWGRVVAPHIHRVCRVVLQLFITKLNILTTGLPPIFSL
jgi:hypothetical protein